MRKSFIYGIVLTTAFLSGCKGDYDDWAAPQGFDAEEAKNINVNITPAAGIEMENVTTETIQLFTASVDAPEGTAARPTEPSSSHTSTSTVGFPRESSISLA